MKSAQIRGGHYIETDTNAASYDGVSWPQTFLSVNDLLSKICWYQSPGSLQKLFLMSIFSSMDLRNRAFCSTTANSALSFVPGNNRTVRHFCIHHLQLRKCSWTRGNVLCRQLPLDLPHQWIILVHVGPPYSILVSETFLVLISSMTSAFTTDLYPLLSMAKVSPCFSDILVPSEVSIIWKGTQLALIISVLLPALPVVKEVCISEQNSVGAEETDFM